MLTNYLKIAWRNLIKNKTFSLINILGLAIGLASFMLIALYVVDEKSYDRFHENAANIYRINSDLKFGGNEFNMAVSSDAIGEVLKNDYPEVLQYTRLYNSSGSKLVKKDNEFINELRVVHADSSIFDVFTLPIIKGEAKNALNRPNTVVITESTAHKYFGTTDVLGKTLETKDSRNPVYTVTAVINDIPRNSHFHFDFLFSMANVNYGWGNFLSHNFQTYILLQDGTNYRDFEKKFPEVINKYILPQAQQFMEIESIEEFESAGNKLAYSLIPLTDIHLHSDRAVELGVNGNIQYVYIFSAIAIFILLIGCVNFMNLSTARSANRAREVGIRKVLGTEKKSLILQFLIESVFLVFISLILAIGISSATISYFNEISGKELLFSDLMNPGILLILFLLPFIVGGLAGSYPAFFLSSFKPISVLKGKMNQGFKKSHLRSGLVVFQFSASIILMVCTLVVFLQLDFIQNKKIGFNKDQVLIIRGTRVLGNSADAFKNEVAKMSGVKSASFADYIPVSNSSRSDNTFSTEPVMSGTTGLSMQVWSIDYNYIPTMGMEMAEGRNFSEEFGSDSSAIIINETTAQIIGEDNLIGRTIYANDGGPGELRPLTIVGVVKNFNFESLRQNVGPLCFQLGDNKAATAFKIDATDASALISNIEKKWKDMAPGMPFKYDFLDESFDQMYRAEQRMGKVALSFAILAILIACLGLFGLATYMAEQRTKEIGVRKVLGASVPSIVSLLSQDFIKLVLIAAIIAFPVSWWAMNAWLEEFAYRIDIGWWVFMIAGLSAILIALVTVSYQAIKAAIANPVKSLRTE